MSTFWFSKNNLKRVIRNIKTLIAGVSSRVDTVSSSVSDLDDDMDDIRGVFLNGNVNILVTDDTLYDSSNNPILDSGGASVKAGIIYTKQQQS